MARQIFRSVGWSVRPFISSQDFPSILIQVKQYAKYGICTNTGYQEVLSPDYVCLYVGSSNHPRPVCLCLSVCLSVCLPACLSVCLSCLSVFPFDHRKRVLRNYKQLLEIVFLLFFCLFDCVSVYLCQLGCFELFLSICMNACMPVSLGSSL